MDVLAARVPGNRATALIAITTALAWLGGEPQLWVLAVVLTIAAARSRIRAVVGVALGTLLVAVQMVPFIFWVLEGDRGPQAAAWALGGAVTPADWSGLLVPGLPADPDRMIYAESLFFGAPLVVCGLLGAWHRKWLLAAAVLLGSLATLPELGGGGIFLALTGGLVRYPSRFALAGLALLLPMVGLGAEKWLEGGGRWLAVTVATVTLLLCVVGRHPLWWLVTGIPAGLMMAGTMVSAWRGVRVVALVGGMVGTVIAALPLVGLQPVGSITNDPPAWPEARDGGRIYAPAPSEDDMHWLATGLEPRRVWPVGYLNLADGLTLARTDSPVANGRLMVHLEMADRGPESRWWLDVLAARWVVFREATDVPQNMKSVRVNGGMRLLRNYQALTVVNLVKEPPRPDTPWTMNGRADEIELESNSCRAKLDAAQDAYVWVSLPPVRGWHWSVDGSRVELEQGPGILQYISVAQGQHELIGRYCPPGITLAAVASVFAGIIVAMALLVPTVEGIKRGRIAQRQFQVRAQTRSTPGTLLLSGVDAEFPRYTCWQPLAEGNQVWSSTYRSCRNRPFPTRWASSRRYPSFAQGGQIRPPRSGVVDFFAGNFSTRDGP